MAQTATRENIEYAKCVGDVGYFTDTFCQIDEPQGTGVSVIPFRLWAAQVQLLWTLLVYSQVIILKARQLGISWLLCAYALAMCLFQKGRVVLAFSRGQSEADELIRRVRVMYDRLPDWLRKICPKLIKDNNSELGWANGSMMESFPATKGAGRSRTASLLIMDEFAWMQFATEVYTAAKPTIDNGGQIVILSTANGEDNLFHDICMEAMEGKNEFKFVFLAWWVHPNRDNEWYARTERGYPSSALMRQEYPATPEEAFTNTGAERFLPSIIWWDNCKASIPALDRRTPIILSADAGVSDDNFALGGLSRWGADGQDVAVRYFRKWVPPRDGKIDFDPIEEEIERICENHNVIAFVYDPHQLHQMATRLQNRGIVMTIAFNQGDLRLKADYQLLQLITNRRIVHDGNTDLREHIDNADKQVDGQERKLRIVKRTAKLKIDGAVMISMGAYKCLEMNL